MSIEQESNIKNRKKKYLTSWTGVLLIGGILLTANFIVSFFPIRVDTSEGQVYSISKGTKTILKNLDDTLLFKIIFTSKLPPPYNLNEQYTRDLLTEYKRASGGKIRIEYLDPSRSQKTRQEAMEAGVMPVQLDVRSQTRRELSECFMGLVIYYGDKTESIPLIQNTLSLEYEITQRIKRLLSPGKPNIGVITAGEAMTFNAEKMEQLKARILELYEIKEEDLEGPAAEELASLWLMGPTVSLEDTQVSHLRDFVQGGGTLGLLLDSRNVKLKEFRSTEFKNGLENLLKEWGVSFSPGLVVDPQSDRIQIQTSQGYFQMINVIDYPYFPLILDLDRQHPITKNIANFTAPFVTALDVTEPKDGIQYIHLAKSSQHSWIEPFPENMSPLAKPKKVAQSLDGPHTVGLIMEGDFHKISENPKADGKKGRVIVFASSRLIDGDYPLRGPNFDLFMNMLDWSAQDETLLSIRSKGASLRPLKKLSEGMASLLKLALILFLPLATLVAGLVVYQRQKVRRALLPIQYREV